MQPVVLHIVPEALQKLILQRDQRCLDGERGRGAHRHGGRGSEGGFYSFRALFLINCSFKNQLGVDLLTWATAGSLGAPAERGRGGGRTLPGPPFFSHPLPAPPPRMCSQAPNPSARGPGSWPRGSARKGAAKRPPRSPLALKTHVHVCFVFVFHSQGFSL